MFNSGKHKCRLQCLSFKVLCSSFYVFKFCSIVDVIQTLTHARQGLHHWAPPQPLSWLLEMHSVFMWAVHLRFQWMWMLLCGVHSVPSHRLFTLLWTSGCATLFHSGSLFSCFRPVFVFICSVLNTLSCLCSSLYREYPDDIPAHSPFWGVGNFLGLG